MPCVKISPQHAGLLMSFNVKQAISVSAEECLAVTALSGSRYGSKSKVKGGGEKRKVHGLSRGFEIVVER